MDGATIAEQMANGIQSKRVRMVQIALLFNCDTDAEALAIKERIDKVIADKPAIQISFNIMERGAKIEG